MMFLAHMSPETQERPFLVLNRKTSSLGASYCKKYRPYGDPSISSNRKHPNLHLGLALVNHPWLLMPGRSAMTSIVQSSAHPTNVLPGNLIREPEFSRWISPLW